MRDFNWIVFRLCCIGFAILLGLDALAPLQAAESYAHWMNIGKAKLENRDSKGAVEAFQSALERLPESMAAHRNLARAWMLADNYHEALEVLNQAAEAEDLDNKVATAYLTGLAYLHMSQFQEAISHLEEAVRLNPHTAALRFQLAHAYQMAGRHQAALEQLQETIRLDPLHASAHFRIAAYARREQDQETFQRHQQEFMRLRRLFGDSSRTPEALERCQYTQAETVKMDRRDVPSPIEVEFTLWTNSAEGISSVAVLETTNGRPQFWSVDRGGRPARLTLQRDGTWQRELIEFEGKEAISGGQAMVGNFHDPVPPQTRYDPEIHALNDVFHVHQEQCRLLLRTGPLQFQDVTEKAGFAGVGAECARWVDYDHDGDVDLVLGSDRGLELYQNHGDVSFSNASRQTGLILEGPITDLAAVDLDSNGAIDLVAATPSKGTFLFYNQRTGSFALPPDPPGPLPSAELIVADDFNNDGHPDLALIHGSAVQVVFGQSSERSQITLPFSATTACPIDYDNDGWLDLCVAGESVGAEETNGLLRLYRNKGGNQFSDQSERAGLLALRTRPVSKLIPADADSDGDTDVLASNNQNQVLRLFRNEGGNAHRQLKIHLVGLKTNPMGIGTRVEVRDEDFWVTRTVNNIPIEIGMGTLDRVDSVRTVWSNGIQDNQIEVEPTADPLVIREKNVAAGSCPYLYAWDGNKFQFMTDLLGNSPVGLSLARGKVLPADPEEIVRVGTADQIRPRQGFYRLEITEELREVLYLDTVRFIAVDHPRDTKVYSTDKLMPPPFHESEVWLLKNPVWLQRATGNDGVDRTDALRRLDGVFAAPGIPLPPPYRGLCHPLTLTLDFGELDPQRPLVLALTGWIQYGDASVNIAASQNSYLQMQPPQLQVQTPDGWKSLEVTVGMPAGKTKTILCDLTGVLPENTGRLRVTTNVELRWDQIALFEKGPKSEMNRTVLSPARAQLYTRGFSEIRQRQPGHPFTPDYYAVSPIPPWRTTLQGWHTRHGDVMELVEVRDGKLVFMGGGDGLDLRFEASQLPPLPNGFQRTFFFYSVGWDKDGDYNVVNGDTVEPYPEHARGDWLLRYNTRWVGAEIEGYQTEHIAEKLRR